MAKKQIGLFVLIAVLIGVGIGILIWIFLSPKLGPGVFYYQVKNSKANLFLIKEGKDAQKIISFPGRELDLGDYRPPRHTYISQSGQYIIYFKETGEIPIETTDENIELVISRVFSKPILVNLKTGKETEIEQPIDSSSLVFSSNDAQIAWVKEVSESTYEDIEKSNKKRELWVSRIDGKDAQVLQSFDENVILLKNWSGNYIYFQGLWDVNFRSLGRVNTKTRKIEYLVPKFCEKLLENCQDITFSFSGHYILYNIYNRTNDKEITELYFGDFEEKKFQAILTTDRISDKLWHHNEKEIFYTEQEIVRKEDGGGGKELRETIHLVNLRNQTDDAIYTGSYVSQLTLDIGGRYLYFLEKENDESFKLVRLDIKTRQTETILADAYNNLLLIQP